LDLAVKQKKELDYVEDLNRDLERVECLQKQLGQIMQKRATIAQKLELVAKYRLMQENAAHQASDGLKAVSTGDSYLKVANLFEKLSELVESGQSLQKILENKPPSFSSLEKLKVKLDVVVSQVDSLDTLIESIEDRSEEKCQIETELKERKKELKEVAGGRCPLCGAAMKKS